AVAAAALRPPRRRPLAPVLDRPAAAGDRPGAGALGRAARLGATVLPDGVPARLCGRPGPVLGARALRARPRHGQSSRPTVQLFVPQRRLPRRAPRPPRPALDAAARAGPRRRDPQPLAGGVALA